MNLAFYGCSKIGRKIVEALKNDERFVLFGCASRDYSRCLEYKNELGFQKAYESYEDLLKDDNVDLVYVSTYISNHFNDVKACLEAKKNVIVEKSFTVNSKESEELIKLSHKNNVFLAEAIWTRYMPSRIYINELINDGIIGDIYLVSANLSYKIDNIERLIKKELGGGALLDVGVYPINFALMVLGDNYIDVKSTLFMNNGVDETDIIHLIYPNNVSAILYSSMKGRSDRSGYIYGSKGYLYVDNINNPYQIIVHDNSGNLISTKKFVDQINGYEYQFYECYDAITNKKIETKSMPHSDTQKVMDLISKIQKNTN